MTRRDCEDCNYQCWIKDEIYTIKSPFEEDAHEIKSFKTEDEFWNWFLVASASDPSSHLFDDFRITGCWNWLIDSKDSAEFNEIIMRLNAAEIGIPPVKENFDNAPAILVEQLLYARSELNRARTAWQEKKNSQ